MNEQHNDVKYKKELLDLLRRVDKILSGYGIEIGRASCRA